jgi:serine/threonine protein kinase
MTTDDLIGTQIDEYLLEALLGEGGMARVYRAKDVRLQRYAAIKVITPAYRKEMDYLQRFEREARAIASLEHPHIVRLYRYGEANGLLYMAMQFIQGMDLNSVLQDYRQSGDYLEFPEAARLIGEIANALDYIHAQGLIHRDVKSSNIMLDKTGRAYLADFGLVLFTEVGTRGEVFGSPHYLAPEQAISSAKAVPQSDLYSLGVIAYEMFTGQLPFDAPDPIDIAMLHMSQEPPAPRSLRIELPEALEAVLLKALAKKPADRCQSGAEFAEAVRSALAAPSAAAQAAPPTRKTIPERVALDLANRPLPPIPAAALTPPPLDTPQEGQPDPEAGSQSPGGTEYLSPEAVEYTPPGPADAFPQAEIETPPPGAVLPVKPSRSMLILLTGAALLVSCAMLICLVLLFNRHLLVGTPRASSDPAAALRLTATGQPAAVIAPTATKTLYPPVPKVTNATLASTATLVPSSQASITPSPTPGENMVSLVMVGCEDGHCLGIINRGQAALPLAGLVIKGKDYEFKGEDWGLEALLPGGCLVLTGDSRKWSPGSKECDPAAATLTSRDDFWKKDLEVTYAGFSYGVCPRDRNGCSFTIPVK